MRRANYVGRYGWVTARVTDDESLEVALEWLRESYYLKAPAHCRDAAFADEPGLGVQEPADAPKRRA